jgi:predicted regulator of Ras-like GTPase activity (Roadblock/LC7/MglB family)
MKRFRPIHGILLVALLMAAVLGAERLLSANRNRYERVAPDPRGEVVVEVAALAPLQIRFFRFLNSGNQEVKFFVARDERGGLQVASRSGSGPRATGSCSPRRTSWAGGGTSGKCHTLHTFQGPQAFDPERPRTSPMPSAELVLYEEEFQRLDTALKKLRQEANARAIFLIDRTGQQIAAAGEVDQFDTTSLASLTAGNVAATDGLAKLIGEREFSVLFHEGQRDHIHISIVAKRAILLVIFDERSSLGLVRLRVKRSNQEMEQIFEDMKQKVEKVSGPAQAAASPFAEITDEDIDALFSE